MYKLLFSFFLLFNISQGFSLASTCADSVKICYYSHYTNNNVTTYTITIDTFDLDSGFVKTCQSVSTDPYSVPSFSCSNSYWTNNIVSLNVSGDTTEIIKQEGSANGWINISRKVFTYDVLTGYKLSESIESWNGSSWVQTNLHQWIYNGSNFLIEESSNGWRTLWNFTGNILLSKTYQLGSAPLWTNKTNYFFIYDINGVCDSVRISEWNSTNNVWDIIGISPYQINLLKLANFSIVKPQNVSGFILNDSISYSIDTLANIIYHYELMPTGASILEDEYSMDIFTYGFVNGIYKTMSSYSATWKDGHNGGGLYWYCTWDDQEFTYDSAGYLIMNTQSPRCVMPHTYTTNYYYNSNHLLVRETGWLDSGTQDDRYTKDYFFAAADSLIVYMYPWLQPPHWICQGNSFLMLAVGAGGCGSYNFNWSPSAGFLNPNVDEQLITVHDSILYMITVTDSIGQTASMQLPIYPALQVNVTVDSSACIGCSMILSTPDSSFYLYQWYYNGNSIANSDTSAILATVNGSYYVTVTSSHGCSYSSNPIDLLTINIENITLFDFNIYPNPTSGLSKLTFNSNESGNIRVSMNNMTGEETLLYDNAARNSKDFSLLLNGDEMSSGIYVITVRTEQGVRKVKWVVGK